MRILQLKQLYILRPCYSSASAKVLQIRNQSTQSITITQQEIKTLQIDGAVCLRGKFSSKWLQKAKEGIRKVYENPGKFSEKLMGNGTKGNLVYFNDLYRWPQVEELAEFVFHSPASSMAKQLMGSERVAFWHEHVFIKEPGTCHRTPWHQDQPYYHLDGFKNCSFWIPMDKVLKKDSIKYIKGSHRWGKWFIPRKFETNLNYELTDKTESQHEFCEMVDIDESKYEALAWDLEPGDCIAFHMLTVHGAPESTDENGRQVLALRWLGDDITLAERPWQTSPVMEHLPVDSKPGESIFKYPDVFPVVETSN